jgi:ubiquinone/menaquinone biosynthesis C-methylase UbiE
MREIWVFLTTDPMFFVFHRYKAPIMVNRTLTAQAFEELASNYEKTVDEELQKAWGVSYPDFVEQVLRFAGVRDEQKILDIATGTGLIPRRLVSMLGPCGCIVGLDITYTALQLGKFKIKFKPDQKTISFTCATATALPFAPDSFDCVICALATHHINQDELLRQAFIVLKPGGKLIISDVIASPSWKFPGIKPFLRLAAYVYFFFAKSPARAWIESQAVTDIHTQKEWVSALSQQGFSAIHVSRPFSKHAYASSGIILFGTKDVM